MFTNSTLSEKVVEFKICYLGSYLHKLIQQTQPMNSNSLPDVTHRLRLRFKKTL